MLHDCTFDQHSCAALLQTVRQLPSFDLLAPSYEEEMLFRRTSIALLSLASRDTASPIRIFACSTDQFHSRPKWHGLNIRTTYCHFSNQIWTPPDHQSNVQLQSWFAHAKNLHEELFHFSQAGFHLKCIEGIWRQIPVFSKMNEHIQNIVWGESDVPILQASPGNQYFWHTNLWTF